MTLSSRQAEVFTQSSQTLSLSLRGCVCVCVCECVSGLPSAQRHPDCRSVPVVQVKTLALIAHSSSLVFLLSLFHSLALSPSVYLTCFFFNTAHLLFLSPLFLTFNLCAVVFYLLFAECFYSFKR